MAQAHFVVLPIDGGTQQFPLKSWLKAHPEELPGVDFSGWTSHQMRAALIKRGWIKQETPTEFRLLRSDMPSSLILASEGAQDEPDDAPAQLGHFFGYERELRDFLATNLPKIEVVPGKRLKVYIDPAENDGVEYQTGVGRIDILAVDEAGDFYVFELKRADSADDVFGQVSRYMGWMRATIGKAKNVSGVIVARQITEKLRYAAYGRDDVHLFEYEVSFRLHPARELATQ